MDLKAVGQNMKVPVFLGAQLDAWKDPDSAVRPGGQGFRNAVKGIVVGKGQDGDALRRG